MLSRKWDNFQSTKIIWIRSDESLCSLTDCLWHWEWFMCWCFWVRTAEYNLPVHPDLHSCWVGACALSCHRKPLCQPAGILSAGWLSQKEPQPDLMQSGPQGLPAGHKERNWSAEYPVWFITGFKNTLQWSMNVKHGTYIDFFQHLLDERMFGVDF